MSSFATIRLVMSREIRQRLRSRTFKVTTVLICVGVLAAGLLYRTFSGSTTATRYDVDVVGLAPTGFAGAVSEAATALGIDVQLRSTADAVVAEQQLRDGTADAAVVIASAELLAKTGPPAALAAAINSGWRAAGARAAARQAGLDETQIQAVLSPPAIHYALLDGGPGADNALGRLVGTIAAVLLFMSINVFGGMVLTGVVEEKSTGVVEVLLAHVRAYQLLAGKVFGIGAVAMIQFMAAITMGVIALRISGTTVPRSVWVGLPTTLLWFVVGFVLYSTLFALAGSFVSRQEDAQGAAAPISILFTAAYLMVFVLGNSPSATSTRIVSVLPPFAPLLMPLRIAIGSASVLEIALAAVLLLAATVGMLRLAGAVYGRTLLHRGSRLRWGQALRMRGE